MLTNMREFSGNSANLSEDQRALVENLYTQLSAKCEGLEDSEEEEGLPKIPLVKIRNEATRAAGLPAECDIGNMYIPGETLEGPLKVVPVYSYRTNAYFEEVGKRSTRKCYSPNGKQGSLFGDCKDCPKEPWKNGVKNLCTRSRVIVAVTHDLSRILEIRFSKTSEPAGELITRMGSSDRGGLWGSYYFVKSARASVGGKSYYKFEAMASGVATDKGVREICKDLCAKYSRWRKELLRDFSEKRLENPSTRLADSSLTTSKLKTLDII